MKDGEVIRSLERSVGVETVLRSKKSVGSLSGGGSANGGGVDRSRSGVRGRKSIGVGFSGGASSVERGRASKRHSLGVMMEGGTEWQGTRTRGIRSVFGGRRGRSRANLVAANGSGNDGSQLQPRMSKGEAMEECIGAPGKVEIEGSIVSLWDDTSAKLQRSSSGREDRSPNRAPSSDALSASDRASRALSTSLPRGGTVWESAAPVLVDGFASEDADLEVDVVSGSESPATTDVGSRSVVKPIRAYGQNPHAYRHEYDGDAGVNITNTYLERESRSDPGHADVMEANDTAGSSCLMGNGGADGLIFRRFAVQDEADTSPSPSRGKHDGEILASSSVSSDSGEPGARVSKREVDEAPDNEVPDAPDVPSVQQSRAGYKNVTLVDTPNRGGGGKMSRDVKVSGAGLRWSDKLRRAGSGRR